jgi:SAM-dependent methyltransferase
MGWGSDQSQTLRWKVLLEVPVGEYKSILDVGCGVGDLCDHIPEGVEYTGIDEEPEMIRFAQIRHPSRSFICTDILDCQEKADLIVSSGLFTFRDETFMLAAIRKMWECCTKAVAFNSLSTWGKAAVNGEFSADPAKVFDFCHTLAPYVVLRCDYLGHDFSVYMMRERG